MENMYILISMPYVLISNRKSRPIVTVASTSHDASLPYYYYFFLEHLQYK
jgi:hypothetical protein